MDWGELQCLRLTGFLSCLPGKWSQHFHFPGSIFTCPNDIFYFCLSNFTCHLTYLTPIILGICLCVKADLHLFMVQNRLYSCTFIYLLIFDLKTKQKTIGCQSPVVFSRLLFSVARGDRVMVKFELCPYPLNVQALLFLVFYLHHPTDRIVHTTSCGVQARMRNSSVVPPGLGVHFMHSNYGITPCWWTCWVISNFIQHPTAGKMMAVV